MPGCPLRVTSGPQNVMSALPPIATLITFFGMSALGQYGHQFHSITSDKTPCLDNVRFTPQSGHSAGAARAEFGMHCPLPPRDPSRDATGGVGYYLTGLRFCDRVRTACEKDRIVKSDDEPA